MSTVFISYRQTDDGHSQRVRAFAERLRRCGIDVVLDQFFLDSSPGGPNDGWDKWSSDRALRSEYVLIVGTDGWFQCFEKNQPPGTGLGAACEADDLRHRIYEAGGVIDSIRVVVFDDADAETIPGKLKRYHRFHAERDFDNLVRWLGGTLRPLTATTVTTPHTTIPHNLPALQPFFGREDELRKIADALHPESRTWGALIDGPGGMGKTSLAVRAAYDAPPDTFDRIVYVSLKSRELDDDGVRDLSGFLISGLAELLNEVARELDHAEINKAVDDDRPRLLLDVLRGTRTLLVLDNLESLLKTERDVVFTFIKRLPAGCKAILTSRGRIGSAAEELILEKLSEDAALATLAELAERSPALEKTSDADRRLLYHETGGKPLLLRWTAGQIGRGSCVTLKDAIAYLRSCPDGNDPLEFIFGDLVGNFTDDENRTLCALSYFTLPAKVEHIAELAGCPQSDADRALRGLINRSLVVATEELKTFTLVPLVADFLRQEKPRVVAETGYRLEGRAFALVVENGYEDHDRFPILEAAWPTVAAALPRFLAGRNEQLQTVCAALDVFFQFTGRWDEQLALCQDAENRAVASGNLEQAGWRAYDVGWVYYVRNQPREVIACADRVEAHWREAPVGARERASAIRLRGQGHLLMKDYPHAIAAHREAVEIWRTVSPENPGVATALNSLARAHQMSGDLDSAERGYREALRIAKVNVDDDGIATYVGNLASVMLERGDGPGAELLAREALGLAERIGRLALIAADSHKLAKSLVRQGKKVEALPHARRAVELSLRLRSADLAAARATLAECESELP